MIYDVILKTMINNQAMKKPFKKLKKTFRKYKDDLFYLLIAGVPAGILIIILNHFINFGDFF